jgi:hypothetical protein
MLKKIVLKPTLMLDESVDWREWESYLNTTLFQYLKCLETYIYLKSCFPTKDIYVLCHLIIN